MSVADTLLVRKTTEFSLLVQLITGIFSTFGLTIKLDESDQILQQILGLELIVQIIEFGFYIFFVSNFNLETLAINRYSDWVISTPTMLFSMAAYFFYEEQKEKNIVENNLLDFTLTHKWILLEIFFFNFFMLVFGYLGETGLIDRYSALVLGTACFARSFYVLYKEFADKSIIGKQLFSILIVIWGLYGVAFLTPVVQKNIGYNILDIIAKNFFGLYLFYKISSRGTFVKYPLNHTS
jgi:bacteriorhodopsin